jgi:hypothetical protein
MLNRTYLFAACVLLGLSGCSNTNVDLPNSYCKNNFLNLPDTQHHSVGDPRYPHPSNDPAAMGAGDFPMGSDCYPRLEELDDLEQ